MLTLSSSRFFSSVGVLQLADDAGDVDLLAAHAPARAALFLGLGLGVFGLGLVLRGLVLVLYELVDALDGLFDARLHDLLGQLLLIEGDDLLDVADAALEVLAERGDLADDDGGARDRLHDAHLATLDALGDLDLALARQQRDGTHLAEVHADGVVGLFQRAWGQVKLDVGVFRTFFALLFTVLATAAAAIAREHVNALGVDGRQQVVQVVGGGDVTGQQIIDLTVGEIALFLTGLNETVYIFFVLIDLFSHDASCSSKATPGRMPREDESFWKAFARLDTGVALPGL